MDEQPDKGVWRRLFVAFLLCAAIALVCWRLLPRAGLDVPWYIPALGFAAILFSVLVRRSEEGGGDDGDGEDDSVAGRIGPSGDDSEP